MQFLKRLMVIATLCFIPVAVWSQDIGTVNFAFNSDQLDASGQAELADIAARLRASQSYKPTVVVGFTDAVGSSSYNLDLGMRRARTVANALVAMGVPVDRVGQIESEGENQLLVRVPTPERQNRRVTVTLEDIMGACRSYREVQLSSNAFGAELDQDLRTKLATAISDYQTLVSAGTNGPAYQMAGAAREDCGIAIGFSDGETRKLEYVKRCFCSSARLDVAAGRASPTTVAQR